MVQSIYYESIITKVVAVIIPYHNKDFPFCTDTGQMQILYIKRVRMICELQLPHHA